MAEGYGSFGWTGGEFELRVAWVSWVKKTKPASLAGAQGRDMGATCMEGPVPDRFDQLFGFVTPFRPPRWGSG